MENNNFRLNLIKGVQLIGRKLDENGNVLAEGVQTYVGTIKMSQLLGNYSVPVYEKKSDTGYQRKPKEARIRAVTKRIDKNPEDPTIFADCINLNLRMDQKNALLGSILKPLNKDEKGAGSVWQFTYGNDLKQKFQIVDGQTRVLGTQRAIDEARVVGNNAKIESLKNINVNINITFTKNEFEEAYQFYLINTHAAKIPAEGAHRILYKAYKDGDQNFATEINRDEKIQSELHWG